MDIPSIITNINNIYNLLALLLIAIVYVIIHYKQKKQNNIIIDKFNDNNKNIIDKLEELNEQRNTLDLQSSMDIIKVVFKKSNLNIIKGVREVIEHDDITNPQRKNIIYEKIKIIINTQYDEDILILNRIYYKNTKLSSFVIKLDKFDLIEYIFTMIDDIDEIIDYTNNQYTRACQTALLNISL